MSERLLMNLVVFARTLRAAGVVVRAGGVPDAVRALADIGLRQRGDVRDALRAVLICRRDDVERFDEIFDRFWRVWPESADRQGPQPIHIPRPVRSTMRAFGASPAADGVEQGEAGAVDSTIAVQTYSAEEAWRRKDFAVFTREDVARAKNALAKLTWDPGARVTRRWIAGAGRTVDLRRLLRVNSKYAGELIAIPRRMRRVVPRSLVLICDVSGSMEPYVRMLLLFAHALAGGTRPVEVFVFSTRLTRVTRLFAGERVDRVLARVQEAVEDWSGGTRIGAAIRTFNVGWARRVLGRSPVVLLISDGWDLGDPEVLRREIAWLQRSVFRLIWLNPLLGSPDYEPLARGMRAALPFVDDFLPVHNMTSLDALAARLNIVSDRRAARSSEVVRLRG